MFYHPGVADETYLEGSDEYEAALAKLAELIADLRPFWPLVVPLFIGWVGRQFDTQGAYFGEAWAQLTPGYAAWKTEHYPGKGILSAEGDLRRAATHPKREATAQSLVLRITGYEKTERSTSLTAAGRQSRKRVGSGKLMDPGWFQEGTGRMVARPLLAEELPLDAQDELATAANEWVTEIGLKLGLLARP